MRNIAPANLDVLLKVRLLTLILSPKADLAKLNRYGGLTAYNLTTFLYKASILTFFLRFSRDVVFRVFDYFIILVILGYSLVNTISSFALVLRGSGAVRPAVRGVNRVRGAERGDGCCDFADAVLAAVSC